MLAAWGASLATRCRSRSRHGAVLKLAASGAGSRGGGDCLAPGSASMQHLAIELIRHAAQRAPRWMLHGGGPTGQRTVREEPGGPLQIARIPRYNHGVRARAARCSALDGHCLWGHGLELQSAPSRSTLWLTASVPYRRDWFAQYKAIIIIARNLAAKIRMPPLLRRLLFMKEVERLAGVVPADRTPPDGLSKSQMTIRRLRNTCLS